MSQSSLHTLWQQSTNSSNNNSAFFEQILLQKPNHIINKLQTHLRYEMLASIVFSAVCTVAAIYTSFNILVNGYCIVLAIFCAIFALGLFIVQKKINTQNQVLPAKQYVIFVQQIFTTYIQFCKQLALLLIPCTIALLLFLYLYETQQNAYNPTLHIINNLHNHPVLVQLFIWIVVYSTAVYFFTKWYVQKMYGQYVTQLQQALQAFDENE
jgi:hypothetical protein